MKINIFEECFRPSLLSPNRQHQSCCDAARRPSAAVLSQSSTAPPPELCSNLPRVWEPVVTAQNRLRHPATTGFGSSILQELTLQVCPLYSTTLLLWNRNTTCSFSSLLGNLLHSMLFSYLIPTDPWWSAYFSFTCLVLWLKSWLCSTCTLLLASGRKQSKSFCLHKVYVIGSKREKKKLGEGKGRYKNRREKDWGNARVTKWRSKSNGESNGNKRAVVHLLTCQIWVTPNMVMFQWNIELFYCGI